jgi:hypothetical protein
MLCKNFRQKYSKIKKFVTRTPVSTNGTFFSSDSYFGGLREYYIQKWLKNSKKNSLVLGGLKSVSDTDQDTDGIRILILTYPAINFSKESLVIQSICIGSVKSLFLDILRASTTPSVAFLTTLMPLNTLINCRITVLFVKLFPILLICHICVQNFST